MSGDLNKKSAVINVAYDYPIKPGTDAWKKLSSHDEMLAAIQIPADVLKNMSTGALVQTCLNYPLSGDMMVYDSLQQGLDEVISRSNCLQELLRRDDAGKELLVKYGDVGKQIQQDAGNIDSKKTNATHYFDQTYVEMLLAQNSIRKNMSEDDEKALVKETLANYKLKQGRSDIYNFLDLQPSVLIMKNVLEKRNPGLIFGSKQASAGNQVTELFNNKDQIVSQAENFTSK
jgi:hypothetical protein